MAVHIIGDELAYRNNARAFAGILSRFLFLSILLPILVGEWTMPLSSSQDYNSTIYPLLALFGGMGLFFWVAVLIGRPNRTQRRISSLDKLSSITYLFVAVLLPTTTVLGMEALLILPLGFVNLLLFFKDESFDLQFTPRGLVCKKRGRQRFVHLGGLYSLTIKASRSLLFRGYDVQIRKKDVQKPALDLRINEADRQDRTDGVAIGKFFSGNLHKLGYSMEKVKGPRGATSKWQIVKRV